MMGVLAKGIVGLTAGFKARLLRFCPKVCITQKLARSDGTDMVSNDTSAKRMTDVHSKFYGEPPSRFVTMGLSHTREWGHADSYEEEDQRMSQEKETSLFPYHVRPVCFKWHYTSLKHWTGIYDPNSKLSPVTPTLLDAQLWSWLRQSQQ